MDSCKRYFGSRMDRNWRWMEGGKRQVLRLTGSLVDDTKSFSRHSSEAALAGTLSYLGVKWDPFRWPMSLTTVTPQQLSLPSGCARSVGRTMQVTLSISVRCNMARTQHSVWCRIGARLTLGE